MFNRIIVPVDGSDEAWLATEVADRLAASCGSELELLLVAGPGDPTGDRLRARIGRTPWAANTPELAIISGDRGVATAIADYASRASGGVLVMATSGRGRSQAVLGSTAAEVLAITGGPIIAVGPKADADKAFQSDELIVTVDGSEVSETALGLAGAWGDGLQLRPWVVSVVDPQAAPVDAVESGYVARLAQQLAAETGQDAEFEVLHDDRPARAITDFAESHGARFIVLATHGRTGLARLTMGSVAADVVRNAPCPVIVLRPEASLLQDGDGAAHAAV